MSSMCYEVLQATSMLLFILSSMATNRKEQYLEPSVARPLVLSGLPGLCLTACLIHVPDDELYGPAGAATQMAYKGWIAEVFGLWENRYRNELQDSLSDDAIPPEMQSLGDLRRIRNDFLHSGSGTATAEWSGRCEVLKWFKTGDRIVFGIRHVLDFLNQMGILTMGGNAHDAASHWCSLNVLHDRDTLLNWSPKPRLVSVRTLDEGKDTNPPYKGVTVVFDNGLYDNVPFHLNDKDNGMN